MVQNPPSHQLKRLLCSVTSHRVGAVSSERVQVGHLPERRLLAIPCRSPRCTPAYGIPAGLMLPVIVAPPEREMLLAPDDLRTNLEPAALERRCQSPRIQARVPDTGNVSAKQLECLGPIHSIIVLH